MSFVIRAKIYIYIYKYYIFIYIIHDYITCISYVHHILYISHHIYIYLFIYVIYMKMRNKSKPKMQRPLWRKVLKILKDITDTPNKWRETQSSWIRRFNIIKLSIFLKLINPMLFQLRIQKSSWIWKPDCKMYMGEQRPKMTENFEEEIRDWGICPT